MSTIKLEKDYEEFIGLLNSHKVEYLIIGAYAMAQYAQPRNTGDMDFLINPSLKNVDRMLAVLADFGFGKIGVSAKDFVDPEMVIQLGFPPVRIDLLTSLRGLRFEELWASRTSARMGKAKAHFISLRHLVASKEIAGRAKDKADLAVLKKVKRRK
jgi:hypothetical protein